jgi:primosomal protein N' (replication factor Y)
MRLADVALPVPVPRAFTYEVPASMAATEAGDRVVCPVGSRRVIGVVLAVRDGEPPQCVRALVSRVDDEPAVPLELLAFLRDVSSYYLAPIGEVLKLALPPLERDAAKLVQKPTLFAETRGIATRRVQWVVPLPASSEAEASLGGQASLVLARVRAHGAEPLARLEAEWGNARAAVKRLASLGLVAVESREAKADPFFAEAAPRDTPPELTPAQAHAADAIGEAIEKRQSATFLLHGVTGSGKTEVYLRAIARAKDAGTGAIVLVPEIALTPQLVARFRARFGDDVAVLHSALTPRERLVMWKKLHLSEVNVAIGARSALFAPVPNLGLILVDEEHDPSFKQEEGVRYHARDMAILRSHRSGGVCVLGSATPSLESEQLVRSGKARKLHLPDRARKAASLPRVEIVDLRRIGPGPTGDRRISLPLHRALEKVLAAKEQAILFLNRRGFSPSVRCLACGELVSCRHCSVALTFHKARGGVVRCHYCDYEAALPSHCTRCSAPALALEGLGTEKLEETLAAAFPEARVARLDRDVASGKGIEKVLDRVRSREVDILVGTQMVTKGHDLPHVTLVGVINADAALSIPDFRAAERAFQLLVQVAGRAGRGDAPGHVLVQTYDPEHPAIVSALRHDVDGFTERELRDRRELAYPPFSRLALVRVDAPDEADAQRVALGLADAARASTASAPGAVDVLGPAPAPLARLRNRYRYRVMLRSADRKALRHALLAVERARAGVGRNCRVVLDVDPVQLL